MTWLKCKEIISDLRCCKEKGACNGCSRETDDVRCEGLTGEAADLIEELLRIGIKMHTWIFLNTGDEQAAYDEIGLTDEQNALLGYSGQIVLESKKENGK